MANKKYVGDHYSLPASSLTPTRPREVACRLWQVRKHSHWCFHSIGNGDWRPNCYYQILLKNENLKNAPLLFPPQPPNVTCPLDKSGNSWREASVKAKYFFNLQVFSWLPVNLFVNILGYHYTVKCSFWVRGMHEKVVLLASGKCFHNKHFREVCSMIIYCREHNWWVNSLISMIWL